jgi:hypothetical protein
VVRLKSITLENFKAIKHPIKIAFKPITLLFGPNNAGKSTIIQSLIYAREIFVNRDLDPYQCEMAGERIDLGGFRNLVHNHDLSLPIIIDLELSLDHEKLPSYTNDDQLLDQLQDYSGEYLDCLNNVRVISVRVSVRWDYKSSSPFVESYMVVLNEEVFCEITSWDFHLQLVRELVNQGEAQLLEEQPELKKLLTDGKRTICSRINLRHSLFFVANEVNQGTNLLAKIANSLLVHPERYQWTSEPPVCFQSCIDTGSSVLPDWDMATRYTGDPKDPAESDLGGHEYWRVAKGFDELLSRAVVGPGKLLRDSLRKFRHLGPLRAIPPRTLEQSQLHYEASYRGGFTIWEELFHIDEQRLNALNDWMSSHKRLNTGYSIDRKIYREFDVKLTSDLEAQRFGDLAETLKRLPERIRLLLRQEASGLELSFHDVGTGISQVIPVVIAALTSRDIMLAIEQPELHIHPAVQVNLADLFISQIQDKDSPLFLLETHSEHLILRMLRRIRETSENKLPIDAPPLTPDQVSVFYIEPENGAVRVSPLRIDSSGDFVDRWPKGFFSERFDELM